MKGLFTLVHDFIARPGSLGWLPLVAALLVVAGTWGFIAIAGEVTEGDTQTFDKWAVESLRKPDPNPPPANAVAQVPIGPKWMQEVGRDITGLGGIAILGLATLAVAGYLLMVKKYHAMWLVLIATTGGLAISSGLKTLFARPRPDVSHFSYVYSSSFPSGHSMLSAVVYLTLGILLARIMPRRQVKIYFIVLAILLTGLVGASRVYMGVHYPTDVLAGWSAGLAWALLCWLVARWLQHRGAVEQDVPGFPATPPPGGFHGEPSADASPASPR